eukprot:9774549-Heterocapsa_arctica.AAC.1
MYLILSAVMVLCGRADGNPFAAEKYCDQKKGRGGRKEGEEERKGRKKEGRKGGRPMPTDGKSVGSGEGPPA